MFFIACSPEETSDILKKNPTFRCKAWGFHIQDYGTLYYVMAYFEMNVVLYNRIIG